MVNLYENHTNHVEDNSLEFKKIIFLICKGKIWVLITLLLFLLLAIQFIANEQKIYSANSVFGFKNKKQNFLPQEISFITAFPGVGRDNEEVLTQIRGRDFLRNVVIELNLLEKPEFQKILKSYNPKNSIYNNIIEKLFSSYQLNRPKTLSEKIEVIVNQLKRKHIEIHKLETGGYKVSVKSNNPDDAALIANTIVKNFLELRLKEKIKKSEKSLEYLSTKLGQARLKMENAKNAAELFALEQNVLSNEEFANQSRRLKEFRISIEKLNSNYNELLYFNNLKLDDEIDNRELEKIIDLILDLSPRIKPPKRFLNDEGIRDLKKEFNYIKDRLPKEIKRLKESIKITNEGFENLEEKAKKTSSEARKLQNLQMELTFATTRYEALSKEFETQSLVEGYEAALGEIYETAMPPLKPTSPKIELILAISIIVGLLLGFVIAFLFGIFSNKIFDQKDFENILNVNVSYQVSNNFNYLSKIIKYIQGKRKSKILNKDMLIINHIASEIINNKNLSNENVITFISSGRNKSLLNLALSFAYFLSNHNFETIVVNNSINSIRKDASKKEMSKTDSPLGQLIDILPGIRYLNKEIPNTVKIVSEKKVTSKNKNEIVINVIDQVETKPHSISEIVGCNYFLIASNAGKTRISSLKTLKTIVEKNINKCLAYILVSN